MCGIFVVFVAGQVGVFDFVRVQARAEAGGRESRPFICQDQHQSGYSQARSEPFHEQHET
jgi:hypothetical protein